MALTHKRKKVLIIAAIIFLVAVTLIFVINPNNIIIKKNETNELSPKTVEKDITQQNEEIEEMEFQNDKKDEEDEEDEEETKIIVEKQIFEIVYNTNTKIFTNDKRFADTEKLVYRNNTWEKNELQELDLEKKKPMIGERALGLFEKYAKQSTHVFEYGAGGTTYFLSQIENIEHIWSTDPAERWFYELKDTHVISYAIKTGKLDMIKVYYGPIGGGYSFPKGRDHKLEWPNWAKSIDLLDQKSKDSIDLVFVDGRFRISCLAYAMLKTNNDCLYMIHDADRYVSKIKEFADLVESQNNVEIAVFKKKENFSNRKQVEEIFEQFKYTVRKIV